jgi:RNA polymerase sigma-70 factor (ECF subfamily)
MADLALLIEAEIPRLRRYAVVLTRGNRVETDDLVQDCLVRALSRLHLWQAGTDLRAWLFTILHNVHVNRVRKAVRQISAAAIDDDEPRLVSVPNQNQRLEVRDLQRALDRLPQEQRQVLYLICIEGLRYEEVAAIQGVPAGTVRSRLSRGRDALRVLTSEEGTTHHSGPDLHLCAVSPEPVMPSLPRPRRARA